MSSKDKARRKELANKFPEVDQHSQEIKKEIYEPQIDRLGETKKEQKNGTNNIKSIVPLKKESYIALL